MMLGERFLLSDMSFETAGEIVWVEGSALFGTVPRDVDGDMVGLGARGVTHGAVRFGFLGILLGLCNI